ncbi:MAG: right-handed parallel beta-helix repeat-containing protein [Sedimentisphaerales bacterium]|nr:right-handed parallel beta-helix repeat-containing protein [Sedimentisphaerales bacterium]
MNGVARFYGTMWLGAWIVLLACLLSPSTPSYAAEIVGWGYQKTPNATLSQVTQIAAGGSFSIALKADGTLVGWGLNDYNQATPPTGNNYVAITSGRYSCVALKNDGSIVGWGASSNSQITPPEGNDYIAIAAGGGHFLALKADGRIVGWGIDNFGQATPPEGNDYVAISAGWFHSLALKNDGSIAAWGWDNHNQTLAPEGNDYVAIAAGGYHNLALKSDGSVVGWGYNVDGQASSPAGIDYIAIAAGSFHSLALRSDGSIAGWGDQSNSPAGNDFVAIAAGDHHSLALRADSNIIGWGSNLYGQANPPAGNEYIAISAGVYHSLALQTDGSIIGWGNDTYGQPPPGHDFVAIAAGGYHSLALKADGSIVGWGDDRSGQATPPEGKDFIAIRAGRFHSLALRIDGSIIEWGSNYDEYTSYLGQATPPLGNDYVAISAGRFHSLALKNNGSIVGWGSDIYGKATPLPGNDYVNISAGGDHSLALRSDGSIIGWGDDRSGQVTPPAGNDYVAITAGSYHSLALRSDGSIIGWGSNDYGQATPLAANDYMAIAAGNRFNLALKSGSVSIAPLYMACWALEGMDFPVEQNMTLYNRTVDTVNWTLTVPDNCPWLDVDITAGDIAPEQEWILTVTVHPNALSATFYRCEMILQTSLDSNQQVIPFVLRIYGPMVGVSSTALDFVAREKADKTESQVLMIHNYGGDVLTWSIDEAMLPEWLSVEPAGGNLLHSQEDEVLVSIDHAKLSGGQYTFNLEITDPKAENSPQSVHVTLTVISCEPLQVPYEYSTIQDAINTAVDGDTILVADGVYTGEGNRDIDFMGKAITLRSANGPETCIIDCESQGRGFQFTSAETHASILEGFTIQKGKSMRGGGGIYCEDSSPTIRNCIIIECTATFGSVGGGIALKNSNAIIYGCQFEENRASVYYDGAECEGYGGIGGGIYWAGDQVTIRACVFKNNSTWEGNPECGRGRGGGAYITCECLLIDNCLFLNNFSGYGSPGALRVIAHDVEIFDSVFLSNGGIWSSGCMAIGGSDVHSTIKNCVFADNHSFDLFTFVDLGHEISFGGFVDMQNCTIHNDELWASGIVRNCIIGPKAPYRDPQISYSCFSSADGTNGNVYAGPLFADPNNWDFHLKSEFGRWDLAMQKWVYDDVTSPCIDAGDLCEEGFLDDNGTPTDPNDDLYVCLQPAVGWQNELWPNGGRINMGAYGGTPQASMSSNPIGNIADLDHDNTVEIGDLSLLAHDWLQWQILLDTDLDRNGSVNLFDLAILAGQWMWNQE